MGTGASAPLPDVREPGIGATADLSMRVSSAVLTLCVVPSPEGPLAILERKVEIGKKGLDMRAQPLGGGIAVLNVEALSKITGGFNWEDQKVARERDLRIYVNPDSWTFVRELLTTSFLDTLPGAPIVETTPVRELQEEIGDAAGVEVSESSMNISFAGLVFQDPGCGAVAAKSSTPTARVFSVFDVVITDPALADTIMREASRPDSELIAEVTRRHEALAGREPTHDAERPKLSSLCAIPVKELLALVDEAGAIKEVQREDAPRLANNVYALSPKYQEHRKD
jgi:hypothetical protein